MSIIRFEDKQISTGKKQWTVTGNASNGIVTFTRVEGDITDAEGLRQAAQEAFNKPRYAQAGIHGEAEWQR